MKDVDVAVDCLLLPLPGLLVDVEANGLSCDVVVGKDCLPAGDVTRRLIVGVVVVTKDLPVVVLGHVDNE